MAGDNEQQRKQWNDPVRAKLWPKREPVSSTMTPVLLEALALEPGERVLDIGCGGGLTTLAAAKAVGPSGAAVGFDISEPMCALASSRAREAGASNVRFLTGDAQAGAVDGAPFDAAMSQFGVMFFAEPAAAFANIRRHLRPGGRLAFICWQALARNAWLPGPALAQYMPQPPPAARPETPPPGPFAFADVEYVRKVLADAGFSDIERSPAEHDVVVPADTVYDRESLDEMRLPPEHVDAAWRDLQAMAAQFRESDGQVRLPLAAQLFTARNPG